MAPYWDTRTAMPLDIEETEENYVITASVPGYTAEDLKIEVEDNVLTIRAEHNEEEEEERNGWHLRERFVGTMERRLRLGEDINAEDIDAELENGILTLRLTKAEEAKPKLIEVKSA
jgi:HSP20 family protein